MNLELKDKVVIVTWDSKGIGGEISNLLAAEGAIPVLVGRDQQSILDAVKTIHDKNQKASYAFAEVTIPENCKDVVASIMSEFGRIDGLVNNACVNDDVRLESDNYEGFMGSIPKYLAHYYPMAHLALPELKKRKGAIVNIGSKTSGYVATNGVNNALTSEWAVELLPYSIRVNAVIVAESFTPHSEIGINTFVDTENKVKEIRDEISFKNRMPTCEEIANTVVFLLSDKSSNTTGQLLFLDEGYAY